MDRLPAAGRGRAAGLAKATNRTRAASRFAAEVTSLEFAYASTSRRRSRGRFTNQTEAVRQIVREYLLEHPEVIERAMITFNAKRREEKRARERATLVEHRAALTDHPLSPVSGSPVGEVTLVEFFEYQCGYCKCSLSPTRL